MQKVLLNRKYSLCICVSYSIHLKLGFSVSLLIQSTGWSLSLGPPSRLFNHAIENLLEHHPKVKNDEKRACFNAQKTGI